MWDEDAKCYDSDYEGFWGSKSFKPHRWNEDAHGYEDDLDSEEKKKANEYKVKNPKF